MPLAPVRRLAPSQAPWLRAPATRLVIEALHQKTGGNEGDLVRFVGGCVRNTLLGAPVDDLDIATVLEPPTVMERLERAKLKAVPTGLAHGTVTAVAQGKPFEITTLRRDVATDGRHAVVSFSTDWAEDARRRDFTMNALYAAPDGTLHDPLGGLADLDARRVRFIGEARQRIREDYLRILRFFRFHAWYGQGVMDQEGLRAIAGGIAGLAGLSGERIQREMFKLLDAADPVPALKAMEAAGVLDALLPPGAALPWIEALVLLERDLDVSPDSMRRFAALVLDGEEDGSALSARWRLSKAQSAHLQTLARLIKNGPIKNGLLDKGLAPDTGSEGWRPPSDPALRRLIYEAGSRAAMDWLLLAAARHSRQGVSVSDCTNGLRLVRTWTAPRFPLQGRDALDAGVPSGPPIGTALSRLETEWIASDFTLGPDELRARLQAIARSS